MSEEERRESVKATNKKSLIEHKDNVTDSEVQLKSSSGSDDPSAISVGANNITFTVTIAVAVPTEPDDQAQHKDAAAKLMIDSPRVQNYYHVEYSLLPGDELVKTDVVTYGVACKIFMEKYDARVVKTWQDRGVTWFAWAHSTTVSVTKEMLMKIFSHTIELRLWNTKDKCSSKARFDRPKAFRLPLPKPGEKPEDVGGVKTMVTKLLESYIDLQPRKGQLTRPLLVQLTSGDLANMDELTTDAKSLGTLTGKDDKDILNQLTEAPQLEKRSSKDRGKTKASKDDKDSKKQQPEHLKLIAEQVRKYGICMIPLKLSLLFGGYRNVIGRLDSPVPGLLDTFIQVSIDSSLLTPAQEEELNPMIIEICSAKSLPSTPISHEELKMKCQPVFCKYKFFKEPEYVTPRKVHCRDIHWDDANVILLGTKDSSQLKEYLTGPGMEIEVHDRDRKPELITKKAILFGMDPEDEYISNVGTVENRRTLYNPFQARDKPWDPYGVARLDFSELLFGCKFLELKIPILNCHIPDILGLSPGTTGKLVGLPGAVDGPVDRPLSAGHYVQESSMLKVRIRLAHSLIQPSEMVCKEYLADSLECPFNRIIFTFDYNNFELLQNLHTLVMSFNARALHLDTMPQHAIDAALAMYKLSIVEQCSLDLDIITGFHVLDGEKHIFVLEGLRGGAINTLWETLGEPIQPGNHVLYNSDLSFSRRLYGPLDVELCRIKLHEPLSVIVQQPLLYVRDMVFRPCFDALTKLNQITKMDKMRSVVKSDLFPTAEMVVSMSREFGVPFSQKEWEELKPPISEDDMELDVQAADKSKSEIIQKVDSCDSFHDDSVDDVQKDMEMKNHIDANIKLVHLLSEARHVEREKSKQVKISVDMEPAYNYSIQFLNSTELAKDRLRQYLRQLDPNGRYTYSQEYMSGMFSLVDPEKEKKEQEAVSHAKWKTEKGWTNPAKKSIRDCYAHPKCPDSARVHELREKWIENMLHANILKSPLDRDHYPWCDRNNDLDLYTRPPQDFDNAAPVSVCTAGIHAADDKKAAKLKEMEDWRSRVVTEDIRLYVHRQLPATEMKEKGFYCSNQLDRLKSLLKDPPRKRGLVVRGCSVSDIPALSVISPPYLVSSVIHNDAAGYYCTGHDSTEAKGHRRNGYNSTKAYSCMGYVSTGANFCGLKPGDKSLSWTRDDNQIPCYNYEHSKFQKLKGQDFNCLNKSRNKLSTRPILPLKQKDKENHLFRTPHSASPYVRPLPANPYVRPLPPISRPQTSQIVHNSTTSKLSCERDDMAVTSETILQESALTVPHNVDETVCQTVHEDDLSQQCVQNIA